MRVVTPGTLTEEGLLDARGANRLAAIAVRAGQAAVASVELSTGEVECLATSVSGLGSALALFLYPPAVTGLFGSASRHVVRRNAVILPAYSLALGLIALLGTMALASGVQAMPAYAREFKLFGANYAVPALFRAR